MLWTHKKLEHLFLDEFFTIIIEDMKFLGFKRIEIGNCYFYLFEKKSTGQNLRKFISRKNLRGIPFAASINKVRLETTYKLHSLGFILIQNREGLCFERRLFFEATYVEIKISCVEQKAAEVEKLWLFCLKKINIYPQLFLLLEKPRTRELLDHNIFCMISNFVASSDEKEEEVSEDYVRLIYKSLHRIYRSDAKVAVKHVLSSKCTGTKSYCTIKLNVEETMSFSFALSLKGRAVTIYFSKKDCPGSELCQSKVLPFPLLVFKNNFLDHERAAENFLFFEESSK